MLYTPIHPHSSAADLADELGRARRIVQSLSNPDDLRLIESYIAELEMRMALRANSRAARPQL